MKIAKSEKWRGTHGRQRRGMYWRQRTALRRGRRARALCAPFFCFTSTKGGPIPRSLPARPYLRPGGHIPVGNKNTTGCRLQCKRMTRNHQCWTRVPLVSYDLLKIELENGKKREGKGGHALSVFLEKQVNVPFSYEYALLDF